MATWQWRNTNNHYGLVNILLHWLMAISIIGLFFLGRFMVDLDYYSRWYHSAPDAHRSIGMIVAALLVLRFCWRISNPHPATYGKRWEVWAAQSLHWLFYALLAAIVVSGYLITTADGQGVSVFNWFDVPATLTHLEQQEDVAGDIHRWLANITALLVLLHALAALKHHFIEKDFTLKRMLGISPHSHN